MTSAPPDVDAALREIVSADGVHLVHVWAPWCGNSLHELRPVWAQHHALGADSVTFVTVWNDGEDGSEVLEEHGVRGIPEVVVPGAKPEKEDRRLALLGLPMTWIPTTWVFNCGGLLAYAFGYGEGTAARLAEAVRDARSGW